MPDRPFSIKAIPAADLEVVAMVYVYGEGESKEVDFEVINKTLHDLATFEAFHGRCDCCGSRRLVYDCLVVHRPTLQGFHVGRTCANKLEGIAHDNDLQRLGMALAQKAKVRRRLAAWTLAHPQHAEIVTRARQPGAHPVARDIAGKLGQFGSISDSQVALLYRLESQTAAREAEPKPSAPITEGRQQFTAEVLTIKSQPNQFGQGELHKMLLRLPDLNKVWCTKPSAHDLKRGDRVTLKATLQRSPRDPHFAFGSRPVVISVQPCQALAT